MNATSRMPARGLVAVLIALWSASCGGNREANDVSSRTDVADDSEWFRTQVPDSVLTRGGACPFECCIYGAWRAEEAIQVRTDPGADAVLFSMHPGERFQADSGFVRVRGHALVAVTDTVTAETSAGFMRFEPGDTLGVLDYVGEGRWNVWHDGRVLREVAAFWSTHDTPSVARDGAPALHSGTVTNEWWVRVTAAGGRRGWIQTDAARFSGADACAGPLEWSNSAI